MAPPWRARSRRSPPRTRRASWGSISRWPPTRSTSDRSGRRSRLLAPAPSAVAALASVAARAAGGQLTVNDLLLYSTMCGTGLDAVPLPGDASLDGLTGLLLDLGVIALRLQKPLTAPLMPIPRTSAR